jgi:hypothetical protein
MKEKELIENYNKMVTGFEQFSYELTEVEQRRIYPKFVAAWKARSFELLITMTEMTKGMQSWIDKQNITNKTGKRYKMNGPRMRKLIHCARVKGDLSNVIANSNGYYKTTDVNAISNFIKSCRQRASSFAEVANAMETYNFERDE